MTKDSKILGVIRLIAGHCSGGGGARGNVMNGCGLLCRVFSENSQEGPENLLL